MSHERLLALGTFSSAAVEQFRARNDNVFVAGWGSSPGIQLSYRILAVGSGLRVIDALKMKLSPHALAVHDDNRFECPVISGGSWIPSWTRAIRLLQKYEADAHAGLGQGKLAADQLQRLEQGANDGASIAIV